MIRPFALHGARTLRSTMALLGLNCLLLVPAVLAKTGGEGEAALAIVNGEPVTVEMLTRNLGRTHESAAGTSPTSAIDSERLLFKPINDVLLAQEARALEMDLEPSIVEQIREYKVGGALKLLERDEILALADASEEEIKELFQRQYARVTFHVVTAYEKEGAQELRADLEGGADVATLAEERSVDPYRARGGLVDHIARFDLARNIAEVLFSLKPGEIGGPVPTDLGWSVVRVESFEEADLARLPELESTLRGLVYQRKAGEARVAFIESLKAKYPVQVSALVVDGIVPKPAPDGRLQPDVPDPEAIVAEVGTTSTFSADDYGKALSERWKRVRNVDAANASAPMVLESLIQEELFLTEALARDYTEHPAVVRGATAYETELLALAYLDGVLAPTIVVTEEAIEAYFDNNKEKYHRPPRVRLGQITVESHQEAERIAEMLRAGSDLKWLAREHSIDRLAEEGGDRGWYVPQLGVPGRDHDLLTAETGTVLDPIGVPGNWVVTRVEDRAEQGIYPLNQISGNVRQAVFDQEFLAALDQLIETLRSRSTIVIDDEALASISITGSQSSESDQGDKSGHGH